MASLRSLFYIQFILVTITIKSFNCRQSLGFIWQTIYQNVSVKIETEIFRNISLLKNWNNCCCCKNVLCPYTFPLIRGSSREQGYLPPIKRPWHYFLGVIHLNIQTTKDSLLFHVGIVIYVCTKPNVTAQPQPQQQNNQNCSWIRNKESLGTTPPPHHPHKNHIYMIE